MFAKRNGYASGRAIFRSRRVQSMCRDREKSLLANSLQADIY